MQVLSISQARASVDALILSGESFLIERVVEGDPPPAEVGPITKEFFSRLSVLRSKTGGFVLAASEIEPSDYLPGYLSLGHSEDWDIVQKPGEDEVLVVEGSETCAEQVEVRFVSVYHLVLDEATRG